jgi:hypothetical protein
MNESVSLRNINDFVVSQKTRERELHRKKSVVVITKLISEVWWHLLLRGPGTFSFY